MVKVTILYPNREGCRFDAGYYLDKHIPLAMDKLGPALKGVSVEMGINGGLPDSPPPYAVICNLQFDSAEAFYEAFLPHIDLLQGDIPNYTDIEPVFQISEVRLSR